MPHSATFEAAVVGAGPAGLVAALALARCGADVALIGPIHDPARSNDQRTTALMGSSLELLKNLGAWESCALDAAPIAGVRICDDRGGLLRAPELLFSAAELGIDSFGANIANRALVAALNAAAERAPGLQRIVASSVTRILPGDDCVDLELAEGATVAAKLVVAADGRASMAPAAAGIAVQKWPYPQVAVVATFAHTRPHASLVNELHRRTGPLTTVPLPGNRSSLVWVEAPKEAARLLGLDEDAFALLLEEHLQGLLGSIRLTGQRASYPLMGLRAERMGAVRIALVGEAAHVVPPLGAQGLNLGLRDAAALADCVASARASGQDIGGPDCLAAYHRVRAGDVLASSVSIDLLNRSLLTDLLPVEALRGLGAHVLARLGPLRRAVMQAGMGMTGPLPRLMRAAQGTSAP